MEESKSEKEPRFYMKRAEGVLAVLANIQLIAGLASVFLTEYGYFIGAGSVLTWAVLRVLVNISLSLRKLTKE